MKTMAALLLATLLGSPPALASQDVLEAERARISEDMDKLVQRQVWPGAERKFVELAALGVPLSVEEYVAGATAARELGDVEQARARLREAARIKGSREIVAWLTDIDNNYGHVVLVSVPARTAELAVGAPPFDPNQRKAVDAAIRLAKQDGEFRGLLPKGDYTFAGQKFSVEPGLSVRIEVSPRMRRQGITDPVILYREMPGAITTPPSAPDR